MRGLCLFATRSEFEVSKKGCERDRFSIEWNSDWIGVVPPDVPASIEEARKYVVGRTEARKVLAGDSKDAIGLSLITLLRIRSDVMKIQAALWVLFVQTRIPAGWLLESLKTPYESTSPSASANNVVPPDSTSMAFAWASSLTSLNAMLIWPFVFAVAVNTSAIALYSHPAATNMSKSANTEVPVRGNNKAKPGSLYALPASLKYSIMRLSPARNCSATPAGESAPAASEDVDPASMPDIRSLNNKSSQ